MKPHNKLPAPIPKRQNNEQPVVLLLQHWQSIHKIQMKYCWQTKYGRIGNKFQWTPNQRKQQYKYFGRIVSSHCSPKAFASVSLALGFLTKQGHTSWARSAFPQVLQKKTQVCWDGIKQRKVSNSINSVFEFPNKARLNSKEECTAYIPEVQGNSFKACSAFAYKSLLVFCPESYWSPTDYPCQFKACLAVFWTNIISNNRPGCYSNAVLSPKA